MAQLRVAPGGEHVLPKEPPQTGGFDFGLAARNARLAAAAGATASMPEPMSTGTTICGVVYAGGVVLDAFVHHLEPHVVVLQHVVLPRRRPPLPPLRCRHLRLRRRDLVVDLGHQRRQRRRAAVGAADGARLHP